MAVPAVKPAAPTPALVLESSGPVLLFDIHRTPYTPTGRPIALDGTSRQLGWTGTEGSGPTLVWTLPDPDRRPSLHRVAGTPLIAQVTDDGEAEVARRGLGGQWEPHLAVLTDEGRPAGSVWVRDGGSCVMLPFDPNEAMANLWTEAYLQALTPHVERALALGRSAYYHLRPVVPRHLQIAFRRRLAHQQARTAFPRWPVEPALHDLYDLLFGLLAGALGQPVPSLAPWPSGRRWAFVLTHDVETAAGLDGIEPLRAVERRHGLVSAWNFVPERYELPASLRAGLLAEGCEIGVHGLTHDGHDVESPAALAARLPAIRGYARMWGATGFRAPAMQRSWAAMDLLDFDHDASFPDTDPFQPCRGGCCTWWPIMHGDMVELPLTLPQDHTLFVILEATGPGAWIEKTELLRTRGGLAQVLVHPDYLGETGSLTAYEELLATFVDDPAAWFALPAEVSSWWRARARSSVVVGPSGWEAVGPAADRAEVRLLPERRTTMPLRHAEERTSPRTSPDRER